MKKCFKKIAIVMILLLSLSATVSARTIPNKSLLKLRTYTDQGTQV